MTDYTLARNAISARAERGVTRIRNRVAARLSGLSGPATAFVSQPEPRTIGSFARGRQLMAGNFLFAGHLVQAEQTSIWAFDPPDPAFEAQIHGFAWLDDLAAVSDFEARVLAQNWLNEWIGKFSGGKGPGWTPELAGRRIIRWINHALFLLKGQEKERHKAYFRSLGRQAHFLSQRWTSAPSGLPRFEALTGLIYAGLALEGKDYLVKPAMRAIAVECSRRVDSEGGIPTRNPEELMEVFTLLTWASMALGEAGHVPFREHLLAIERIAPTLRALRHSDGSLARFHGGGAGMEGRLDQSLANSGVRSTANSGLAMGFARMSAGRTSIVVDATEPPSDESSENAHASTLGFEVVTGRRPLIVSCGPGAEFGADWQRAGRATASHSTLGIDGYSSSRFAPRGLIGNTFRERLIDAPSDVRIQQSSGLDGSSILATHNGYSKTHGLMHVRRLDLSLDGRELAGEDSIGALSESDRIIFEKVMNKTRLKGVSFALRFHLHPDVKAELDLGGTAVSLSLKSGEVWVFRTAGQEKMSVDASVYLESGRLKPRPSKQIVVTGDVLDYSTQITWSLSRAQDGDRNLRDLAEVENMTEDWTT